VILRVEAFLALSTWLTVPLARPALVWKLSIKQFLVLLLLVFGFLNVYLEFVALGCQFFYGQAGAFGLAAHLLLSLL